MQHGGPWALYERRLRRVTAYIHDHLDEDLDMDRLAEIACLSPYHWHRIYRGVMGETPAATVRRLRLQRAALALTTGARAVADIAAECGFPNVQSFSRTFRAAYGKPPLEYRRDGNHAALRTAIEEGDTAMYDVTIREQKPQDVIGLDHRGSYMTIGKSFDTLTGLMASRGLFGPENRIIAVYYDDPDSVAEEDLRSTACFTTVRADIAVEPPLRRFTVAGGRYAVLLHRGPYSDLHLAYAWLYRQWLPQSNLAVRNEPPLEIYLNTPQDTAPTDLLTEICIPVE